MLKQPLSAAFAVAALAFAVPARADVVPITQAKAQAGGVTPGDTPGFPVTISQPGSYRLDSNLNVAGSQIGLQITAANVTIDLNGFTLDGANVGTLGVFGNSVANSVTIENGTISRFKQDGVHETSDSWSVDRMRVSHNGRYGVSAGRSLRLTNSDVFGNGSDGIVAQASSLIQGNTVRENGGNGVKVIVSTVLGNEIFYNHSYGLAGGGGTGFGNNSIQNNNFSGNAYGDQVEPLGENPLQPNFCSPEC